MIDLEDRLTDLLQRSAAAVPVRPDLDDVTTDPTSRTTMPPHRGQRRARTWLAVGVCAVVVAAGIWVTARDEDEGVQTTDLSDEGLGPDAEGTPETAAALILERLFGDVVESIDPVLDPQNGEDTSAQRALEVTMREGSHGIAFMARSARGWTLLELSTPPLGASVTQPGPTYTLTIPAAGTLTLRTLSSDLSPTDAREARVRADEVTVYPAASGRWVAAELALDDGAVLRDFRPVDSPTPTTSTSTTPGPETTPTASTPGEASSELGSGGPPPWAALPLAAALAPATVEAWSSSGSPGAACPALAPSDLGAGAGAVARASDRGPQVGSWWVSYDLAGAPGEAIPQSPSPDAGVETFFVAAVVMPSGPSTGQFPNQVQWSDGSKVGYGLEGDGKLTMPADTPTPWLAYLTLPDNPCQYQVKTYLGREHLEHLLINLRRVEGTP